MLIQVEYMKKVNSQHLIMHHITDTIHFVLMYLNKTALDSTAEGVSHIFHVNRKKKPTAF